MKPTHTAYARARQHVLDAQAEVRVASDADQRDTAVRALTSAHEALRLAEADVADELAAAWETNRAAVQTAKANLGAALRTLADVETACAQSARRRSPNRPVLSADEVARVDRARQTVQATRRDLGQARERFKAGVTVEQLEAAAP